MKRLIFALAALVSVGLVLTSGRTSAQIGVTPGSLAPPVIVTPGSANQVLAVDGTASAPSVAFASEPGNGWYRSGAGQTSWAVSTAETLRLSAATLLFGGSTGIQLTGGGSVQLGTSGSTDTTVSRPAAGTMKIAHGTATSTAELQVSGGNGGFISPVKALTELTTIAAAATTNTVIAIPVNVIVWAVSVRVVTAIPTAATFTVTSATPAKTWNTVAVPVAANTTDPGTLGAGAVQTAASVITITPNLTPGAATGQVRVTIYFSAVTPPTS